MKRLLYLGLALTALVTLSGCGSDGTKADALRAAEVSLTGYADIYQPFVISYGNLAVCGTPEALPICKNPAVFQKLKAADLAATSAIVAAKPVVDGKAPSAGELTAAVMAIAQAQGVLLGSGALLPPPK